MNDITDSLLIAQFKNGNNNAFESLLNRHKHQIYTMILIIVNDEHIAEDIFQDTFFKIINLIRNDRYTEDGKFIQWACRIAHHLAVDHLRKKNYKTVQYVDYVCEDRVSYDISFDDSDVTMKTKFSADDNIENDLLRREQQQYVAEIINKLLPEQRETVVLHHFAELTFREIAVVMNCSINTALGRMRYALHNLRKMDIEYG